MMLFTKRTDTIKAVARQHGVSEAEVRKEMELAIAQAYDNPDPHAQALYRKLFGDRTPTPEEFIEKVTRYAGKKNGFKR